MFHIIVKSSDDLGRKQPPQQYCYYVSYDKPAVAAKRGRIAVMHLRDDLSHLIGDINVSEAVKAAARKRAALTARRVGNKGAAKKRKNSSSSGNSTPKRAKLSAAAAQNAAIKAAAAQAAALAHARKMRLLPKDDPRRLKFQRDAKRLAQQKYRDRKNKLKREATIAAAKKAAKEAIEKSKIKTKANSALAVAKKKARNSSSTKAGTGSAVSSPRARSNAELLEQAKEHAKEIARRQTGRARGGSTTSKRAAPVSNATANGRAKRQKTAVPKVGSESRNKAGQYHGFSSPVKFLKQRVHPLMADALMDIARYIEHYNTHTLPNYQRTFNEDPRKYEKMFRLRTQSK